MREVLKKYAQRGKIDIFISYEDTADSNVHLKYNSDLAAEYMNILETAWLNSSADRMTCNNNRHFQDILKLLLMQEETEDEEELWAFISKALEKCLLAV